MTTDAPRATGHSQLLQQPRMQQPVYYQVVPDWYCVPVQALDRPYPKPARAQMEEVRALDEGVGLMAKENV